MMLVACQQKIAEIEGMVYIKSATFEMGGDNNQARQDELPKHQVKLHAYYIDATEVTNAQFKKFVEATHYVTTAEKDFEYIDEHGIKQTQKAGSLVFNQLKKGEVANPNTWWTFVEGANWKHPQGPNSSIEGKDNYPVVQVSWLDAQAYCKWSGKRLPTEAEWEYAARGGLVNKIYPWGNASVNYGKPKCNSWDGDFPFQNTKYDNYVSIAPVRSFTPNAYGLYDVAGNVWEWCNDWYDANFYATCNAKGIVENPENTIQNPENEKVIRGGSFLCNDSYCSGFRVASRMKTTMETSLEHTGFRCVKDVEK
ncbi:MAG: formylglycine-generating enzyme family protein [Bacteroidetes bacterium]|nr:formylglycine-generating enzyme family protein [Bacteroidota bacterium]